MASTLEAMASNLIASCTSLVYRCLVMAANGGELLGGPFGRSVETWQDLSRHLRKGKRGSGQLCGVDF